MNATTPKTEKLTRHQVWALLTAPSSNGPAYRYFPSLGCNAYLQSIQREDGSGRSFNLHVVTEFGTHKTVYVRTID